MDNIGIYRTRKYLKELVSAMMNVYSIQICIIKFHFAPALKSNLCPFLGICFTARIMWRKTNAQNLCVVKSFFEYYFLFLPTHWPAARHSMELASRETGPTIFCRPAFGAFGAFFWFFAKWGATKRMTNRFFSNANPCAEKKRQEKV